MTSDLIDERRDALWDLTESFVLKSVPSPLSPLWERFVLDLVLPELQEYPAKAATGKVREVGQERRAVFQRSCALGPFDFTDTSVNKHRARSFCEWLAQVSCALAEDGYVCTRWWPTTKGEMIKLVRAEHEASQPRAVAAGPSSSDRSSSDASIIKKDPHAAAPLASAGEQNNPSKGPSNKKRKAEGTVSTTATTELPTPSSIEGSGCKIKRERTA